MKQNSKSKSMRYVVLAYCVIYFLLFILMPLLAGSESDQDYEPTMVEKITVPLAFGIFLFGTISIWFNEKFAGIILFLWHFMVWTLSLLFWRDAGMILVMIFPMLFVAVVLIRNWYIKNNEIYRSKLKQWELVLRVLLFNYTAIYVLVIFANIVPKLTGWELITRVDDLAVWDYSSPLFVLLLLLFTLFIIGVIASWKSELIAGILFILWYVSLFFVSLSYPEFANSGPHALFGTTILIHGIFYIALFIKKWQQLKTN